ncbi:MAG: hypothetical protein HKM05_10535 [Spirochaetales bacterium]|nr:hypothetical protein [Spirochaetales bacterium]
MAAKRPSIHEAVASDFATRDIEKKSPSLFDDGARLAEKTLTIRITKDDYTALKRLFASHGLSLSAGFRMMAKDYLAKQR